MRGEVGETQGLPSRRLGLVIGGSLSRGLEVRLDGAALEEVKVGRLVTVDGQRLRFFGTITDVELRATDPRLAAVAPQAADPFLAQALAGTAAYGLLHVVPSLVWDPLQPELPPEAAKTVPPHFAPVRLASDEDIARIFGGEDGTHFDIGTPLEMESRLRLDLPLLAQRSNGIFGKTGTGKTFLTRLLLTGLLQKGGVTHLIFDAHNEYGWEGSSEGPSARAKGLKQLFGSQVAVFTLDEESSLRRGISPDFAVTIGYEEIQPEDLELLRETLGLTEAGVQAMYTLRRHFRESWLRKFLEAEDPSERRELVEVLGENPSTLDALARRLGQLRRFPFLVERGSGGSLSTLLGFLDRGLHVVLEFGRYGRQLVAYLLVANFLSRRLHDRYVQRTEAFLGGAGDAPRQLLITLEEAHRFLSPAVAPHTIFGDIAREMRKYHVSLLVIDQRPSGIDDEILSQLGTRFCLSLDNEKDMDAVLAGATHRDELRRVLARLEPKQQVLAFGHALPMPLVVRVRDYDAEFYRQVAAQGEVGRRSDQELERALFGPTP